MSVDATKPIDQRWADMSDMFLKDARYEGQSMHGRCTCAFDAGYLAVLRCLGADAQYRYKHADIAALRAINELHDADVDSAVRFLLYRHEEPALVPSLDDLFAWAQKIRALADGQCVDLGPCPRKPHTSQ